MIFPNKLLPFKDTILAKSVFVLDKILKEDYKIRDLYFALSDNFEDINEFILTLDVLFILGKIRLENERVIFYVK